MGGISRDSRDGGLGFDPVRDDGVTPFGLG
jgi:hypothetical protein